MLVDIASAMRVASVIFFYQTKHCSQHAGSFNNQYQTRSAISLIIIDLDYFQVM